MNHSDIQALMADYLEGDLSLAKRALFDAHLDGCEACASELAEMRRTISLLRALPTPEPPPDLIDNVMRRIREGEGRESWLDRVGGWLAELAAPRIAVPATALATAVAIALVTGDLRLDLPGIGELQSNRPLAASPARSTPPQVARRAAERVDPGDRILARAAAPAREGRPDSSAAPRIASASESPGGPRPAGSQPTSVPQAADPSAGSAPVYVEARPGREKPPVLRGGSPLLSEPPGIVTAAAPRGAALTAPVANPIPKDQRRLIELDGRLNFLLREPDEFARWMSTFTVAEQELWLAQLAERAEERGLVEAVSMALSESDDATGQSLAAGFASAAERNNPSNVVSPDSEPVSE